jgi:uncharacterized membrane protein
VFAGMAKLSESTLVRASLADTWELYFDPAGWPAWVDGFGSVQSVDGYPEDGGTLVWQSNPAGRGTVTERVVEHQPRRRHKIEFSDPESSGELLTKFEIEGDGTRVTVELDYSLPGGGPFTWLTDRLFVRAQVLRSLQRTLAAFAREAEERAER